MNEVPVMVPTTADFERRWREKRPGEPPPPYAQLEDEGKPVTKSVDLDIEVTIGAGLPKNKAFLYQMLERLAPLSSVDEQGVQRPLLSWEELRKFFEDFLGLPLEKEEKPAARPGAQGQLPPPPALENATAQGVSARGQPVAAAGGVR
jgi:hypothetical protein